MLKIKKDCLVLDRGVDKQLKDRFICFVVKNGLVNNTGLKTELGKQLSTEKMISEAVKHGAEVISSTGCVVSGDTKEYRNDAILAFNGGDIVFQNDDLGIFLELSDLATPIE